VISNYGIIEKIESITAPEEQGHQPVTPICIVNSGELIGNEKLTALNADFLHHYEEDNQIES